MRPHGDERGPEQTGKDRVFNGEHAGDFLPAVLCRIQAAGDEIRKVKTSMPCDDFVPAAGNG